MREWADRPPEIAALLNPAFCGFLLSVGVDEYSKIVNDGTPYVFPFLMLPVVLHKPTREMLPRSFRTTFSAWITNENTAVAKVGFAERAKNMVPYVKEALSFAILRKFIFVTESGRLRTVNSVSRSFPNATREVNDCLRASALCGKWFSTVGDFKTAMALLGVKP